MRKPHAHWRTVVTRYPCPVCHVPPGSLCQTTSGAIKYEPHADRSRLAADNGWRDPEECAYIHPEGRSVPGDRR